ncbi:dynein regulatory complex subunit 7-like [Tubulanus polymorphus]|uniref:dynein regulatory complex subunit 7-like n=1 Tax=Tubulanus polymorphus TaxID=672921 RepID=UPI003DA6789A
MSVETEGNNAADNSLTADIDAKPEIVLDDGEEKGQGEASENEKGLDEEKGEGDGDEADDEDDGNEKEKPETEDVEALKEELAKITVEPPTNDKSEPTEVFDPNEFPESYKENVKKELLVLGYAENFRRQYVHLYCDRKPLFLNPVNECGIEKFVCTTIRPNKLPFPEVYEWDGASEFVADYLNFVSLDPPTDLPKRLLSPVTVLKNQKGNCFEYSTLLCSLLIGVGYDAYVVNGYATREVCIMDETREICPILRKKEEKKQTEEKKVVKKYAVKPAKDLHSKYEIKMAQRKVDEKIAEEAKQKREEEDRQAELEKPPPDPLHGLRIHSWVLVLSGKREVPESFFIEPFTGHSHPIDTDIYLGIESLWNNHNYWVNMQDCSEGVKNLRYDLGDCACWEYMFPSDEKPQLQIPEMEEEMFEDDDEEGKEEEVEKHLDMPPSWVEPINISLRDFQMSCPHGKKTKFYKRAKLEKFAHYLMKDGLVTRLSVFDNRELTDLASVREYYKHREDQLEQRVHNRRNGWITEHFQAGRPRHLKEHQYKAMAPGPENDRIMIFYHEARVDGLVKREETPTDMKEHYVDRKDFLYFRHVIFGKRGKKFGPAEATVPRPILKMTEKYHRNRDIPANEDVAEIVYVIAEEKIQLTYHTEDARIASSTREFIKPANADEKGATLIMSSDMHQTFQVDQTCPSKKQVKIYQMMVDLIQSEDEKRMKVRESEEEVQEILNDRTKEELASDLNISVYDTERNEKAKKHRRELERIQAEEKKRKHEMEIDYLAPFLAQIGDPEKISRPQSFKLKVDCLADLKQRLIDKANLIQARFEKETQELQNKQQWYQQHQVSMSKDDEDEYLNYCSEAMFRIHILELRLNRHKEMAPHKYMQLDQRIRSDPRLSEYF